MDRTRNCCGWPFSPRRPLFNWMMSCYNDGLKNGNLFSVCGDQFAEGWNNWRARTDQEILLDRQRDVELLFNMCREIVNNHLANPAEESFKLCKQEIRSAVKYFFFYQFLYQVGGGGEDRVNF